MYTTTMKMNLLARFPPLNRSRNIVHLLVVARNMRDNTRLPTVLQLHYLLDAGFISAFSQGYDE